MTLIRDHLAKFTLAALTLILYISMICPIVNAYAAVTVSDKEANQFNPNSSIKINPDTGLPYGAKGEYYPSEKNPLLGKSIFMTPIECVQKYGENFCACGTLQDGTYYCYYNRPNEGFYQTKEACEKVWGTGMCICPENQPCHLHEADDMSNALQCMGQIYFFSGEKMECRTAGVMSAGENCCKEKSKSSSACSFENVADEVGMDDIAMLSISLGAKLSEYAGYNITEMLAKEVGKTVVTTWIKDGTTQGIISSLTKLLGDQQAKLAVDALERELSKQGIQSASQLSENGAVAQVASEAVAGAISNAITVAGWVYFAYQCYNIFTQLKKCTAGEFILGCKIGKGVCHYVGSRCKIKVFGSCLQKMKNYCCFNSIIARIINEQGRPQIGKGWGSGKHPDCKGFMMDEFSKLDLSSVDFGEYQDDLIRELNPNVQEKYKKAVESLNDGYMQNR